MTTDSKPDAQMADDLKALIEPDAPAPKAEAQPDDHDIPEKLRGKSERELAKMYTELEKTFGKHSTEVGELRGIVDKFLLREIEQQKPAAAPVKAEPETDTTDFFENPMAAITRAIAKSPELNNLKAIAAKLEQDANFERIRATHPDYREIGTSTEFQEWVGKSNVRKNLFARANSSFDFEATNELLSTWKELQVAKAVKGKETVEELKAKTETDKKAAKVPKGGAGELSGKTLRRADLINLKATRPERYAELASEIQAAYREKRVK